MDDGIYIFDINDPLIEVFKQYLNIELSANQHDLADNYSTENFVLENQRMFSMWVHNNEPKLFSTIFRKPWWQKGCYRILNRVWQNPRTIRVEKTIHPGLYTMIHSQLEWCKTQQDFRTVIITRQRQRYLFKRMRADLLEIGMSFEHTDKLWLCKGACEDCLHHVLAYGNTECLTRWWKPL